MRPPLDPSALGQWKTFPISAGGESPKIKNFNLSSLIQMLYKDNTSVTCALISDCSRVLAIGIYHMSSLLIYVVYNLCSVFEIQPRLFVKYYAPQQIEVPSSHQCMALID